MSLDATFHHVSAVLGPFLQSWDSDTRLPTSPALFCHRKNRKPRSRVLWNYLKGTHRQLFLHLLCIFGFGTCFNEGEGRRFRMFVAGRPWLKEEIENCIQWCTAWRGEAEAWRGTLTCFLSCGEILKDTGGPDLWGLPFSSWLPCLSPHSLLKIPPPSNEKQTAFPRVSKLSKLNIF